MNEALNGHFGQLITLVFAAASVYMLWGFLGARERRRSPATVDSRCLVYCKHCNWEGIVRRSSMQCARCRSANVATIST